MKTKGKKILSVISVMLLIAVMSITFMACAPKVKVGVQSGTTSLFYLQGNKDMKFKGFKNITVATYDNSGQAVEAMKNGQVSFVVVDKGPAIYLSKKIKGIKMIEIDLTDEPYGFGMNKDNTQKNKDINNWMKENKTFINQTVKDFFEKDESELPAYELKTTPDPANKDKELVVATNAGFAPFESKKGNKFIGIDISIAKKMADDLGLTLVIKDMDFDSVVTSVQKGAADIAMAGLTINDARKKQVEFTEPYFNASQVVLVLEDNTAFDNCKTSADVEKVISEYKNK